VYRVSVAGRVGVSPSFRIMSLQELADKQMSVQRQNPAQAGMDLDVEILVRETFAVYRQLHDTRCAESN